MLNNIHDVLRFFEQKEEFVAAIQYTAGRFEFSSALIEKDYLCSLILMHLYNNTNTPLIFKGGTYLAKTRSNFNRLSEDLDFTIPAIQSTTRKQRSKQIKNIKKSLDDINKTLPIFTIGSPLTGHNNSCQYTMSLIYRSNITQLSDKILIDIGLRDELLLPSENVKIQTLLIDPFLYKNKIDPFTITGLNQKEAYAEKIRAAFCRKELAIRDFYDMDYAFTNKIIGTNDAAFAALVQEKFIHEKHFNDLTNQDVIKFLHAKTKSDLHPVLKNSEITQFNLERVIVKLQKFKPLVFL